MLEIFTSVLLPILLIVALGLWYASRHPVEIDSVNRMNMDIFTPALIFSALIKPFPETDALPLLLTAAAIVVLLPGVLAWPIARLAGWHSKTVIPPIMFRNSGNLGVPLMVFAFGEQILPVAIVLFIVENTLHFTLGMVLVHGRFNPVELIKTPMILATIAGLSVAGSSIELPTWLIRFADLTGQVAIPLMLFTLGVRIKGIEWSSWKFGINSSVIVLVTGLITFFVVYQMFDIPDSMLGPLLMFAILPPAVLNFLVAERYNIEPQKVATMVLFANLLCPLWILPALNWVL